MLIRNILFDFAIFNSQSFNTPSIGVGNLSVGGTGKSVVVIYLIDLILKFNSVATLSRGYGRKTNGIIVADMNDNSETIGDEPYQFLKRFSKLRVVVSERRVDGMKKIEKLTPKPDIVLMDDVMQHRSIKTDLMIMTTDFNKPYFNDFLIPVGRLRELRSGVNRSDLIIITRTPNNLTIEQKESFLNRILVDKPIFFCGINYSKNLLKKNDEISKIRLAKGNFILVTGIADPTNLVEYLELKFGKFEHIKYPDHHNFSNSDINKILSIANKKIIITTEKDYVRISHLIQSPNLYYLKISLKFIFHDEKILFDKIIRQLT